MWDLFVTRLNPAGAAFELSTYLGGSNYDWPNDIGVDASGGIVVAGATDSPDFPQTAHSLPSYAAVRRVTLSRIDSSTPSCQFSVSPTALKLPGGPATARIIVVAPSGCVWSASSGTAWLTVPSQGTGTGAAEVSATTNPGGTRTGSVTVAGRTITIEQGAQSCPTP